MSLYDDYINSVSKKHFVDFLARKGAPGHAFINVRVSLRADLEIVLATFGLYPDAGKKLAAVKSIFTPVSGQITFGFDDLAWDTKYTVKLSDEQIKTVLQKLTDWKLDVPKYSLFANNGLNCSALIGEIAKLLALKVPTTAGTSLPWSFIKELQTLQAM